MKLIARAATAYYVSASILAAADPAALNENRG
jgi:hypothetical protein